MLRQTYVNFKRSLKEGGWRQVLRQYGWRLGVVIFAYYLIRDCILYILLPYLVYRGAAHFTP